MKGSEQKTGPASAVSRGNLDSDVGLTAAQRDAKDEAEKISRREELDARNNVKRNRVAQLIGATHYVTDFTWPFLVHNGRQTSVSEWYPERKIAIDKFYHVDQWEKDLTDFKRKALAQNGIAYAYLTPEKELADLFDELGLKE